MPPESSRSEIAIDATETIDLGMFEKTMADCGYKMEEHFIRGDSTRYVVHKEIGNLATFEVEFHGEPKPGIRRVSFNEKIADRTFKSEVYVVRGDETERHNQMLNALRIFILQCFADLERDYRKLSAESTAGDPSAN